MKVSIIIPAYNEEETIAQVIKGINNLDLQCEVIVVDDCSQDSTSELAGAAGATVVRHLYNKGNGASIKTGARHAQGDILLFLDADGQHDPAYIPDILEYMTEYDMVVGAREKHSLVRNIGNTILNGIATYLSGVTIPDLTSGYRAIKKEVFMKFIHLLPDTFSYPTTLTLALLLEGFNVTFVPVGSVKRTKGSKSKVHPLRDGFRFLLLTVRIVSLFNPLKVFLPLSFVLFLMGFSYLVYELVIHINVPDSAVLLIVSSIQLFFFGVLADQVSSLRREIR
jgi:glycosyltransferase involved in cell wall biosynthesis